MTGGGSGGVAVAGGNRDSGGTGGNRDSLGGGGGGNGGGGNGVGGGGGGLTGLVKGTTVAPAPSPATAPATAPVPAPTNNNGGRIGMVLNLHPPNKQQDINRGSSSPQSMSPRHPPSLLNPLTFLANISKGSFGSKGSKGSKGSRPSGSRPSSRRAPRYIIHPLIKNTSYHTSSHQNLITSHPLLLQTMQIPPPKKKKKTFFT